MGYLVELPEAPASDRIHRYATFLGSAYRGFQDITFVELAKATKLDKATGKWVAFKDYSVCKRIVDDLRQAVKEGWSQTWLASARVCSYDSDSKTLIQVYPAAEEVTVDRDGNVPKVAEAADGTWRVVPTIGWSKGPRDWSLGYAFIDSTNTPRAGSIAAPTKLGVIQKLFDSTFALFVEYTKTLPLADPADVPETTKPVAHAPTVKEVAADLYVQILDRAVAKSLLSGDLNLVNQLLLGDGFLNGKEKATLNRIGGLRIFRSLVEPIPTFDIETYNRTPANKLKYLYLTDPLTAASIEKMHDRQRYMDTLQAAKEEGEAKQKAIEDLKRKHAQETERHDRQL